MLASHRDAPASVRHVHSDGMRWAARLGTGDASFGIVVPEVVGDTLKVPIEAKVSLKAGDILSGSTLVAGGD